MLRQYNLIVSWHDVLNIDKETDKDTHFKRVSTLLTKLLMTTKWIPHCKTSFLVNKKHKKDTESISEKTDRDVTESDIMSSASDKHGRGNLTGFVVKDKKQKKVLSWQQ